MSILFYGKTAKTTTDGKVPIYIRVTIDGHRWEISTSNYIESSKWASGMGKVRGNSEDARTINMHLNILKRKLITRKHWSALLQKNRQRLCKPDATCSSFLYLQR
jgi:hypothetical protein